MIITITPALPCGQFSDDATGSPPLPLCGQPATQAIISPLESGVWELVPLCRQHVLELEDDREHPVPISTRPRPVPLRLVRPKGTLP